MRFRWRSFDIVLPRLAMQEDGDVAQAFLCLLFHPSICHECRWHRPSYGSLMLTARETRLASIFPVTGAPFVVYKRLAACCAIYQPHRIPLGSSQQTVTNLVPVSYRRHCQCTGLCSMLFNVVERILLRRFTSALYSKSDFATGFAIFRRAGRGGGGALFFFSPR